MKLRQLSWVRPRTRQRNQPSVVQLDNAAKLYQRPAPLNAIDLLPGALPDAWSKDAEPTSTVAELYAALKKLKSRPWPPNVFMNTLKEALGQGVMWRSDAGGEPFPGPKTGR